MFQLRLYAVDGGNQFGFASQSAQTVLRINVQRNVFPPIFTNNNNIQTSISETAFVGTFIVDLNATDADLTVSKVLIIYITIETMWHDIFNRNIEAARIKRG